MSNYECEVDGCERSVRNGDAIHRTSPKGGPFRGRCGEHIEEVRPLDEGTRIICEAIEDDNDRRRRAS